MGKYRKEGRHTDMGVATMVVASRIQPLELHLGSQASKASLACSKTMGRITRANISDMAGLANEAGPMSDEGMSWTQLCWRFSQRNWMRAFVGGAILDMVCVCV